MISPTDMLESFERLDSLISVLQSQSIQVSVVGIPTPFCGLRRFFVDQDAYVEQYLELVSDHLQLLGIPYEEFDRRFFELYPESEDQLRYYNDATHPNEQGAAMFSTWASTFLIDWLNSLSR